MNAAMTVTVPSNRHLTLVIDLSSGSVRSYWCHLNT
jgi:hypothetical protein